MKKGPDKPFMFFNQSEKLQKNTDSPENSYPYLIIDEQFRQT